MIKTGIMQDGFESNVTYGNRYDFQETSGPRRLAIGPENNSIALLYELSKCIDSDYYLLYLLLVPRTDAKPGRYQSSAMTGSEIKLFLDRFTAYLETDARHQLWIGSTKNKGQLIFDNHNIIYAYGELGCYETRLLESGYLPGIINIPTPHTHWYHRENDAYESEIMSYQNWRHYPLSEFDDQ